MAEPVPDPYVLSADAVQPPPPTVWRALQKIGPGLILRRHRGELPHAGRLPPREPFRRPLEAGAANEARARVLRRLPDPRLRPLRRDGEPAPDSADRRLHPGRD